MGKVRRLRQKFQLLKKKEKEERNKNVKGLTYEDVVSGNHNKIHLSTLQDYNTLPSNTALSTNVFSGINIDVDKLKTLLDNDDKVSVRSIAKSLKYDSNGKLMKKDEKRKLKHELFMKKLDAIQLSRKKVKRKRPGKKNRNKKLETEEMKTSSDEKIPELIKIENTERNKQIKKKGIEKAKHRHKNMLDDITAFRVMMSDQTFKERPLGTVSKCVNENVLKSLELSENI